MEYPVENYELVEVEVNGTTRQGFVLADPRFKTATFTVGAVRFTEQDDNAIMHYEYDIVDGSIDPEYKALFEQEIGKLVHSLIVFGLESETLIYTGGVD